MVLSTVSGRSTTLVRGHHPAGSARSSSLAALKREAFYQLMPPPGTFPRLKGTWPQDLRSRYHLSDAPADTALECLTRCGKYEVTVSDPFTKDTGSRARGPDPPNRYSRRYRGH